MDGSALRRKLSILPTTTVAVALVTLLVAWACGNGEDDTGNGEEAQDGITVESLVGTWQQPDGFLIEFSDDGTFLFAAIPLFLEQNVLAAVGEFRLEGTSLTFSESDDSVTCPGTSGTYKVQMTAQGELQFIVDEDGCRPRVAWFDLDTFTRVEP